MTVGGNVHRQDCVVDGWWTRPRTTRCRIEVVQTPPERERPAGGVGTALERERIGENESE
jgi:hypothetical protein